ncbi:MAG: leucine-rich repeat domain-containing protein [Bacteroidaceae bacterium]|nr:leucine-rich repeat domain-containing protein [Bacteroidaceae bacterium]
MCATNCSCKSLKSIVLPEHLYIIKSAAFEECNALTDIVSLNPEPPYPVGNNHFPNWNATVHVPAGSKAAYQAIDMWQYFNIVEDVTSIRQPSFVPSEGKVYDLHGRLVNDNYQGIVIKNGKTVLRTR